MTEARASLYKLMPRLRRGATVGIAATVFASLVAIPMLVLSPGVASAATPQISGSVPAPTASEISPMCDSPNLTNILGPQQVGTGSPITTVVTPPGGVASFTTTSTAIYVSSGTQITVYTLAGVQTATFPISPAFDRQTSGPVVDPAGNVYMASFYGQEIESWTSTGTVRWNDTGITYPQDIFGTTVGGTWELVDSHIQQTTSSLVNPATGAISGTYPLHLGGDGEENQVTQEANGNLLISGNGFVDTYNAAGTTLISQFGDANTASHPSATAGPAQFYIPGQSVQAPDGTIYSEDMNDPAIFATSPQGYYEGATGLGTNQWGGGNLQVGGTAMTLEGNTLYTQGGPKFNSAGDYIISFTLPTVQSYLQTPHAPTNHLGWGAGIETAAAGNYFPSGTPPTATASFNSGWAAQASHLELSYSVENNASLNAETVPAPTVLSLPTSVQSLASVPLTIPTADSAPGPYLIQAQLFDTSTTPPTSLGAACMPYTVGAPGDTLNLSTLPSGAGGGGPADPRGVALNSELGLNGLRAGSVISWSDYLPNCNASAPTISTCGPSAMVFTNASTDPYKASALALADNVTYWIQVSGGDSTSMALVTNGWWQGDIASLVSHYASVPSGCVACAPVTKWEPWNESNNTGWGDSTAYVNQVLIPFYNAVKSVLPGSSSTVIGGSSLGVSYGWWQGLVAAGGLNYLNVVSVHPYSGSNDSFEEDGTPAQVQQLQTLVGAKPVWFTEVGWWSDGDYNYTSQANVIASSMIWQRALNVPVWSYFYDEGSWGNDGISFSLIQTGNSGDDWVKPAALATMETAAQLNTRPYQSMPATGIPQTYMAKFGQGTGSNQSGNLSAIWSDQLNTTGVVTLTASGGGTIPVSVTDQFGNVTTSQVTSGTPYSLPISAQITYVSYPIGDTLTLGPTQNYGSNLALSSAGATATATSGNASQAIAGLQVGYGNGWTSNSGDTSPSITVTLPSAATINRVVVDTQSQGSVAPGLRNYTVSVNVPGTGWTTVATVVGQYRAHQDLLSFAPVSATGVRVSVSEVNFGGYYGGGIPAFWPANAPDGAFIHAVQVYAGTGTVNQVNGTALVPLTTGTSPATATTLALTSASANPSTYGAGVSFTATISSSSGSPSGTISFFDNGSVTPIAGCANVSTSGTAVATCTTSALAAGAHSVTATLTPSGNFLASTAPGYSQTVNTASTTTTLSSDANPANAGSTVHLTATVASSAGTPSDGTVAFYANGSPTPVSGCATVSVSSGSAVCATSFALGTFSISATYTPGSGSNYAGSATSVPLSEQVNVVGTTTAVTSSTGGASVFGTPVTFTATTTANTSGGGALSSGTTAFTNGSSVLCAGALVNGSGVATCNTSALPSGSDTITATYSGNSTNASSVGTVAQNVALASTQTTLSSTSSSPSTYGAPVALTATVTQPGTVSFYDGSTVLCSSVATVNNTATCAPVGGSGVPVGSSTLSATLTPSAPGFARSTGTLSWSVGPAPFAGYYLATGTGQVFPYGNAPAEGSVSGSLNRPVVGMSKTPTDKGYWLVASDGGIFTFGNAGFHGSMGGKHLNRPIVGMASTPSGNGYWQVATDGGIFAFGDAGFYGSTGNRHINKPIVGMASTPDGKGYWLVASDGGIFAFGDAGFYGSTGAMILNRPIVGMAATADGKGYWLVASDGGIFNFGDAGFHGSAGGMNLTHPVVGMAADRSGAGYWIAEADGEVINLGDAPALGSPPATTASVVTIS